MPSIVPALIAVRVPRRVITRDRSRTVRYASFSRTRGSRWGRISSRAVARRMTPSRWTVPASSTKPRGRANANSVRSAPRPGISSTGRDGLSTGLTSDPLELFADDADLFHQHLVGARLEGAHGHLRHPAVGEVVAGDLAALVVVEDDRAVLASGGHLALVHGVVPVPKRCLLYTSPSPRDGL